MDRLAEMYGTDVPWVLLSIADLQTAFESAPYDLLFLDRAIARDEGAVTDELRGLLRRPGGDSEHPR